MRRLPHHREPHQRIGVERALEDQPVVALQLTVIGREDDVGVVAPTALPDAPEHPPAGVVILTESGDIAMRERAQQLGAAAVVTKPLRGDELAEVVEDLLTFI